MFLGTIRRFLLLADQWGCVRICAIGSGFLTRVYTSELQSCTVNNRSWVDFKHPAKAKIFKLSGSCPFVFRLMSWVLFFSTLQLQRKKTFECSLQKESHSQQWMWKSNCTAEYWILTRLTASSAKTKANPMPDKTVTVINCQMINSWTNSTTTNASQTTKHQTLQSQILTSEFTTQTPRHSQSTSNQWLHKTSQHSLCHRTQ